VSRNPGPLDIPRAKTGCQLYIRSEETHTEVLCREPAVVTIASFRICRRHKDLIDAIVRDAERKRQVGRQRRAG
jgi:hypothetical protein